MSELQLIYYISSIQIYLLSTGQILQSGLRVKGNKSSFTFYNKIGDAILLATSNLWCNIQIMKTCILKHNISNLVSLITRHLDFETLHHCFGHVSDKVIYHVFNNVEDVKIYFPL